MPELLKRLRGVGRRDGGAETAAPTAASPRPWERGAAPAEWPRKVVVIRAPRAGSVDATGPLQ